MMRMVTNFVSDSRDTSGSISETIRLVEISKAGKTIEFSLSERFFSSVGFSFIGRVGSVIVV